jgi:ATPase subunit of ABC transporter with duplicated ATPase domains
MAGVDTDFLGEAKPKAGTKIGYFEQEPQLDGFETVKDAVDSAVSETRDLLKEFEDISMKFGEPLDDDEMTKQMDRQAQLQDQIDACDAWNLDSTLEIAMDALRLPPS